MNQNRQGKVFELIGDPVVIRGHKYQTIRFEDSGYITNVRSDSITSGYVKDNLSPSFCGVGIIGYINPVEHKHEQKIWHDMISRCYSQKDKCYKYYGAEGVTVCERWLRFDYFVSDIPKIDGYNQELFDQKKLQLDKDINSHGAKIYSLETCKWVDCLSNQKQRAYEYNQSHRKYAIYPDGSVELILHVSDFCREHGLHRQNVNRCLAGKQTQTKGFRFYKETANVYRLSRDGEYQPGETPAGKDETPEQSG